MNLIKKSGFLGYLVSLVTLMACSCKVEAQQWQARHNLTPAEYQSTFNDLFKQGYRLKCVSGYVSGGSERYAGLWVKESGPEWQARHGLSAGDYQKAFDDFFKQGYRLTWVTGYESGGAMKFAAIWEKKSGPAWEARHNLSAAEYQKAFDDFYKQGYRLLHVSGYAAGGSPRFAAIWEKSGGPAWQARHNLSAAEYQKAFDDFNKQGYRLKDVSGYNVSGTDYYTGIWEKTGGPWWWSRNGTPDAWYQNVFDNFYYQGYQPVLISAFTSGGAGKLNSIWDNSNFSGNDLEFISSQMKTYMDANQVPGAALAITKDGRLVYATGFGYANKETREEAGPTNLFRIASVSKPITSTTILRLIEANKLHLNDTVFGPGGILASEFPTSPANTKFNGITVKYLLQHVSGISNMEMVNGVPKSHDPMFENLSLDHKQLISSVINDPNRVTVAPGTRFEYLNFGFCVLGRVIEKVTGQPYDQYVKQAVLGPIGITDMAIAANTEAAHKPREVKYYPSDAYTLNVTRFDSHGGWVASPIDLTRFAVRVDGLPTKPDIFSATSYTEAITDSGIKDAANKDPNYGFGWGLPQWHNGDIVGTIAYLEVLPNGYTYAVVANTRPPNDMGAFALSGVVKKIVSTVSKWPAYDLF
jgi:CubicO group peptidase (beta-lactamase class C family)